MKKNLFSIVLAMFVVFSVSAQSGSLMSVSQNGAKQYHGLRPAVVHPNAHSTVRGPLAEDFEGTFPGLWTLTTGTGDWVASADEDHTSGSGNSAVYACYDFNGTLPALLTSPKVAVTTGDATFSFWTNYYLVSGSWGNTAELYVDVTIVGGATTSGTVNLIAGKDGAGWFQTTIDLTAYEAVNFTGNDVVISFRGISDWGSYNIAIDDVAGPAIVLPTFDGAITNSTMPEYWSVPLAQAPTAYTFDATIANSGAQDLTNVVANFNVTDAVPASVWTGVSNSTATLVSLATVTATSTTTYTPNTVGMFTMTATIGMTETDVNNTNDSYAFNFAVSDSVMARDNNLPDEGTLGIGGAGELGSIFDVTVDDYLTSVSFYLGSAAVPTPDAAATMNVVIYNYTVAGGIGSLVFESATETGAATPQWHEVSFAPISLVAGKYFIGLKELGTGNIALARSTENYTPNTSWLTFTGQAWTSTDAFAPSFNGNYLLHPNFGVLHDATLSDLQSSATTVSGFVATTLSYNIVLPSGTTVVPTATYTTTFPNATAVVTPASSLPGATTVVVTAEDGTTIITYTINYTVAAVTDATLSDLQSGGTTVTGFAAATTSYSIELPYGTTTVPTATYTTNDANATVVVTPAASLPGATTVVITAADGTTTQTYTINYTIAPAIVAAVTFLVTDHSMTHTALYLKGSWSAIGDYDAGWNGGAEQATFFDDGTNGDVTANDNIWTAVVNLNSDAGANSWEWGINDASHNWIAGNWQFTVPDGTAQALSYTITATDATLSDLQSGGTTVTGFAAATMSYSIQLPYGTTAVPTVTYTATSSYATAVVTPATSLPGSTTVVVTAEDGTTTATYTINYTVAPAVVSAVTFTVTDHTMAHTALYLKGSWSATGDYDATWNGGAEQATFFDDGTNGDVTANDNIWTVIVNLNSDAGANSWQWGINDASHNWIAGNWQFTVPDGTAQALSYTIAATDATLSDLQSGGTTVTGFSGTTMSYNIVLAQGTTVVPTVTYTATSAYATAVVTPAASLPGSTTVVVTAEDGTTTATYTINYTVATSVANLNNTTFAVYPNPSTGLFTVKANGEFNLEVIDIAGKVISMQTINSSNNTISIEKPGVYFLRLTNSTTIAVERVIVK